MRKRNFLLMFALLFTLFNFTPQLTNAETSEVKVEEGQTDESSLFTEDNSDEPTLAEDDKVESDRKPSSDENEVVEKSGATDASMKACTEAIEDPALDETEMVEKQVEGCNESSEKEIVDSNEKSTENSEETEAEEDIAVYSNEKAACIEATDSELEETEAVEEQTKECTESSEEEIVNSGKEDSEEKSEDTAKEEKPKITTFSVQSTPPFQHGDRHDNIVDFKKQLNAIGFDRISETNYYGDWTETRVRQFQEYYGLPVNGKLDTETVNKLDEVYNSPFQKGERHEDIPAFKEKLNKLGYDGISLTTYFGNWTDTRLRQFQEDHGLHVNGIGDSITLALLNEMVNKNTFQKGDRHHNIIELKKQLNRVGFDNISLTSYYGDWTETRVEQFQEYYGLPVNGQLTEQTINKLNEVYNSPFQEGKRHEDIPELKEILNGLGYDGISLTTYFGNWADTRLRQFQEDYGLRVNGIGDSVTLAKFDEIMEIDTFELGDRHPNIIDLKEQLNRVGFDNISLTSYYGDWTETRVRQFQEYYGLSQNGQLDRETVNKLSEVYNSPFQEGKHHEDIPEIKEVLNGLGYDSISLTTYFGSWTDTRLRQFQEDYGLRVNGIGDSVTLAKLSEIMQIDTFQLGDRHPNIIDLKKRLNRVGFDNISLTSYYGDWTETRVRQFQDYYGLSKTGQLDRKTVDKLNEVYNSPFQEGNNHEDTPELKEMLNGLGYDSISLTTYFGNWADTRLRQFQEDHGLIVNGIGDTVTLAKLEEIMKKDTFQPGDTHPNIIDLKKQLNRVGFDNISLTNYYGDWTETRVKQFQEYYNLRVNGQLDRETVNKLNEVYNSPFQEGKRHEDIPEFKEKLNDLGYDGISLTTYFGNWTDTRLRQFQEDHGLIVNGIGDSRTMELLESLTSVTTVNYTNYDLTLAEALEMQMNAKAQTDHNYAYVSKSYINSKNEVTASVLNVRSGPGADNSTIGQLTNGTTVTILGEFNGWYQIEFSSSAWKNAAPEDVLYYLDPSNFINDERLVFQFLDLSKPSNTSASILNNYLAGKGILEDLGQAFIDASRENGVSDIYLLSHALLETGNGSSTLANGVEVNGRTVYNMFGIGANDNCALECGSQRAYEEGWFTPYEAIVGGAQFIGNSYIKAGQNTLYEMRWNPEGMERYGYATHQYATDIGWATKQLSSMYNMYQNIGLSNLVLDIPVYR